MTICLFLLPFFVLLLFALLYKFFLFFVDSFNSTLLYWAALCVVWCFLRLFLCMNIKRKKRKKCLGSFVVVYQQMNNGLSTRKNHLGFSWQIGLFLMCFDYYSTHKDTQICRVFRNSSLRVWVKHKPDAKYQNIASSYK
jgi:hypothetical protein